MSTADLPTADSLRVKLNLIRAYITIEDFNAARTAIQEVLAVSNQVDPELTIQAKSLMAEVNQRSS
jgi:pilus assembly protein FimV